MQSIHLSPSPEVIMQWSHCTQWRAINTETAYACREYVSTQVSNNMDTTKVGWTRVQPTFVVSTWKGGICTQLSNNGQSLTIFPQKKTLITAARILQCGSLLTPAKSCWMPQQVVRYNKKEYEAPANTKGITKLQDILSMLIYLQGVTKLSLVPDCFHWGSNQPKQDYFGQASLWSASVLAENGCIFAGGTKTGDFNPRRTLFGSFVVSMLCQLLCAVLFLKMDTL